jgi:hypothetical protein
MKLMGYGGTILIPRSPHGDIKAFTSHKCGSYEIPRLVSNALSIWRQAIEIQ